MEVEDEGPGGPPKGVLAVLGVVMVIVAATLVALFVFRLQPPYVPSSTPTAALQGVAVVIPAGTGASTSLNYSPSTIKVVIGVNSTVTWVNQDTAIHTVTATDKSFDSGDIKPGASFTFTFTTPGTYTYGCIYHAWMKGTVVVEQSS